MAALCEQFTLCGLQAAGVLGNRRDGLQGIEAAGDGDRVLLTEAERTVTLYKVSDQKPLGSWAVKQGQRLTCPAIYNHRSGEYVVVHDDRVLRVWKNEDVNFHKVFKATLSADVYRVHSHPDAEPLVLFCRGAVRYLHSLLVEPRQEIENVITEEETIRWSEMFVEDGQAILMILTEKDSDFFVNIWRPSGGASYRAKLQTYSEDSRMLDFSATLKNKVVSLTILSSTGIVCRSQVPLIHSEEATEDETVLFVSTLLHLPEAAETGGLVILDDSHIATLTPSSAKQKDCLCIWNTSFQTMQECKEFSQKTPAQLWNYDGKLFIPRGNSLQVLRYTCEPSCLASALGKVDRSQRFDAVPVVNWESLICNANPQAKHRKKSLRLKRSQDNRYEGNPSQVLISNIQNATEWQLLDLVPKVLSVQDSPDFQITAGKIVEMLVTRSRSNPTFCSHSLLESLIWTGKLSHSLCPNLMAFCLEKSYVQLLQMCLQQFIDVPESIVCSCLKTFLSISDDILKSTALNTTSVEYYIKVNDPSPDPEEPTVVCQNGYSPHAIEEVSCEVQKSEKVRQKPKTRGCPVSLKRAVLLNTLLTTAYSETYLLPQLKDLTSDQVILFLSYLKYLYDVCNEQVVPNLPGEALTISQIIDWMNLVLDANFTVLVLLPKAKPLIYSLQKSVRLQVKLLSELNKLEGSLSELQRLQRPSESRRRYSIEVLTLF